MTPTPAEQHWIVAELDAEAAQMESVRALLPASRPKSNASSTAYGPQRKRTMSCDEDGAAKL